MALEAALQALMKQTILIAPYSGQNNYGEETYGTDVSYVCKIEYTNRLIRTVENKERVSTATIFVATTTTLSPRDRLTLPSGHTPANPPILGIEKQVDETGLVHHTVIFI